MSDNFFKKAVYMGIGLATFSAAKLDEFAKEFTEKAKMGPEEGKKWYDELKAEAEKAKARIDEEVKKQVDETLKSMNVARKEDIERLEARIKALEIKINIYD